ncbi:45637_t:CDS:1 [Gigaspora margarita]|uniref:45637_t:CDS:1 n=1 Tax=Gigaspora margarita TaxID=4874 RepID=A0ABN7US85_GIGMA|nr:45637_t:CDS:1 [Gigaspora margarita]
MKPTTSSPQAPQIQVPTSDEPRARHSLQHQHRLNCCRLYQQHKPWILLVQILTTDQIAQTIVNMELDGLLEHTAKKVKTSTSNDDNMLTLLESSPTSTGPIHNNDKRPEPQKI